MKTNILRSRYISSLPIFISMVIAAFGVWYFQAIQESAALFLGIIAGGLADLDNRLSGKLHNLLMTLVCFSVASFLVQITIGHEWLFSILMTVAAFVVTMLGVLDARYRTIAFATLLVMMYTVLTFFPHIAWYVNPMMLICGTLLYSFFTICVHLLFPNHPVQDSMVTSFRKLSDYIMVKSQFFDPDEADFLEEKEVTLAMKNTAVTTAFNQSRSTLFYRLRSHYRHPNTVRMLQYYLVAQNIHERISSRHVEYAEFAHHLAHSDLIFRLQRLVMLQSYACTRVAETIELGDNFVKDPSLNRASSGIKKALNRYLKTHDDENTYALTRLVENVLSISDQFGRLENIKFGEMPKGEMGMIAGQDMENRKEIWHVLVNNLTRQSVVFRHAVRMALIAFICCLLVAGLDLHFGYWILLTALLVCQPNHSATTTRLRQRILGTGLGVIVGSLLPYFASSEISQLIIVVVSTTLFFVFRTARYSFSTFFITIQVLAGFTLIGINTQAALFSRLLDTVLGAVIAWGVVTYLWADWHYTALDKTGVDALRGDAGYLQKILSQFQDKAGHADDVTYRTARRVAFERASSLSSSVSDMSLQPKKYGEKLQKGFDLLQLNYALISSISALGALRSQVSKVSDEDDFLPKFLAVGDRMVNLMQTLDPKMPDTFHTAMLDLQNAIQNIQPNEETCLPINYVLWSQLHRISERLEPYYQSLRESSSL